MKHTKTDAQELIDALPPTVAAHMKQRDKVWLDLPPAVWDWPNLPDNELLSSGEVLILLGITGEQLTRYRMSGVLPQFDERGKWSAREVRKLLDEKWQPPDEAQKGRLDKSLTIHRPPLKHKKRCGK